MSRFALTNDSESPIVRVKFYCTPITASEKNVWRSYFSSLAQSETGIFNNNKKRKTRLVKERSKNNTLVLQQERGVKQIERERDELPETLSISSLSPLSRRASSSTGAKTVEAAYMLYERRVEHIVNRTRRLL